LTKGLKKVITHTMPEFDIIFVLPYLFSDHPSFPEGILKRTLEAEGFSVGVIETPFWQEPGSFTVLGPPRLFFALIPGPVDSIVLNYTSSRKRRNEDLYQENGQAFFQGYPPSIKYKIRPDQTLVVFANCIRQVYKDTPMVIGGLEASLRCFAHYDFQRDKIKRSILLDSRADLLVNGMGEKQLVAIAKKAKAGTPLKTLNLPGTANVTNDISSFENYVPLPSLAEILQEPAKLMEAALKIESARLANRGMIQWQGDRCVVAHANETYTARDLDSYYGFAYSRAHREETGLSPALRMNLFSITSHRGCGGGCAFCSISPHQGKQVISRSSSSILSEIERFNAHPLWKGIVSDIGGATAELYGTGCGKPSCAKVSCLAKSPCQDLRSSDKFLQLLREARKLKGVRQVFLGSGIRHDLMLRNPELLEEILTFHCGKFLRVAPEHSGQSVLALMRKPAFQAFEEFVALFNRLNRKMKRKIQLALYLIVGHPGETVRDVIDLARRLKKLELHNLDVQIFTPTPGTLSTAMYYAGVSTEFERIQVEKDVKALMKRKEILSK
jgi:uncharacterized radical SAM protein YgiQ